MKKAQTMKFMKESVIAIDEKDRQVWLLITDVPKMKAPWQYICFILNVIIPGNLSSTVWRVLTMLFCRLWHNDQQLLVPLMEQDSVYGWSVLVVLSIHLDWMDLFYLLGSPHREKELGR